MEVDLASATHDYENRKTAYLNRIRDFKESIGIHQKDSIELVSDMNKIK